MKVLFLGSGGAFTDWRENYNNNALIETNQGWVLLDCGVTAVQSMKELGVHPADIRGMLITHLHGDHAMPEQFIWERYYSSPAGVPLWKPTDIYAPEDITTPLVQALEPFIGSFTNRTLQIVDNGTDELLSLHIGTSGFIDDLEYHFFRVQHVYNPPVDKPSYGLILKRNGKTVIWSADKVFDRDWIVAQSNDANIDCIFHECTFSTQYPGTVHTHWAQLKTLPAETLRKIVIMHHNKIPEGEDVSRLMGHASRHQIFSFAQDS